MGLSIDIKGPPHLRGDVSVIPAKTLTMPKARKLAAPAPTLEATPTAFLLVLPRGALQGRRLQSSEAGECAQPEVERPVDYSLAKIEKVSSKKYIHNKFIQKPFIINYAT